MDTSNLKEFEILLYMQLNINFNFTVSGDATDFIKKWADSEDVELLSMDLHSIDDIQGERVIVTDAPTPYFYYRYWWLDMANEHPEKKHLMIFYVEEADLRAIYALESFIEDKPDNLFYGIINRNPDKIIKYYLWGQPIRWGEELTESHIQTSGSGAERDERMERIKQQQLESLRQIIETGMPPTPAFKSYHEGVPDGMIPYISYSDLIDYKYNIRAIPVSDFLGKDRVDKTENGEIIAHYNSLEELVDDGWMLD